VPPLRRLPLILVVLVTNIAFDQWTKVLATAAFKGQPTRIYLSDIFRFTYATNEGAFLSLGASLPEGARYWVLTVAVGALLLAILYFAFAGKGLTAMPVAGYALIAAGGLSNWVDRARFDGKVVDFMNMGLGPVRTGIFNVADLQILVGIALVLLAGKPPEEEKKEKPAEPAHVVPPS
jgi:signal peptidase II